MESVDFKYVEDGVIYLGIPENVVFEKGGWRDGGCKFKFQTAESAIGLKKDFFIYFHNVLMFIFNIKCNHKNIDCQRIGKYLDIY